MQKSLQTPFLFQGIRKKTNMMRVTTLIIMNELPELSFLDRYSWRLDAAFGGLMFLQKEKLNGYYWPY